MTQRTLALLGLAALAAGLLAAGAAAQDLSLKAAEKAIDRADPDAVDPNNVKGEKWTLDFQFERPEPIVVTAPAGQKQIYWYVIYTVTNRTGDDRPFVPVFTLFADTGAVARAGIHPSVYAAVRQARKVRFLENAVQVLGKIMPGEENARTGVAIFSPLDPKTTRFTIFVEGLSGEYIERPTPTDPPLPAKVEEPTPETEKAKETLIRLRKCLALTYTLPSETWMQTLDQPVFQAKKWTWR